MLQQKLDYARLQNISILNERLRSDEVRAVKNLLAAHKGEVFAEVKYTESDKFEGSRLWSGQSVGMVSSWICRLVAGELYEWLDVKNACCSMLIQLMEKNEIAVPNMVRRFVDGGREAMIAELLVAVGREDTKANRKWGKQRFLSVINGQSVLGDPELNCPIMQKWKQIWVNLVPKFKRMAEFQPLWENVEGREDKKHNKDGTFIAYVWMLHERKIMHCIVDFFHSVKDDEGRCLYSVGVWKHDEIGVHKLPGGERIMTDEMIGRVKQHVKAELGFDLDYHSDDCSPTEEDWNIYYGARCLHLISNNVERCTHELVQYGYKHKHVRFDGAVLRPHESIPGVYTKINLSFADYVNTALASSVYYTERMNRPSSLQEWYETGNHPRFPVLSKDQMQSNWISFRNCTFDIKNLNLYTWEQLAEAGKQPPFTDHFYDVEVDISKLEESAKHPDEWLTPMWTALLRYQLSQEMAEFVEASLGRVQYPVCAYDDWQGLLYMVGDTRTGKGTVIKVLRAMKPRHKVGALALSSEGKFGLQGVYLKELLVVDDMPVGFEKAMDQSLIQRMVSGEMVPVERKYMTGITDHVWSTPQVWAGNFVANYKDNQGQIAERFHVAFFRTEVKEKRPHLAEEIIKHELPYILLRCVKRYRVLVEKKGRCDFWTHIAPEELRQSKKNIQSQTNLLSKFLNEGSSEWRVQKVADHFTPWDKFEAAFVKFLKDDQRSFFVKFDDIGDTALRRQGYEVFRGDKKCNFCKYCSEHGDKPGKRCGPKYGCTGTMCWMMPNKANCGEHYNEKRPRGKDLGIRNMKLVKKDECIEEDEAVEAPVVDVEGSSASSVLFELLTKKAGCDADTVRALFKNFQVEAHEGFLYEKHKLTGMGPKGRKTPLSDMLNFEAVTGDKDLNRPSKRQKV